MSASESNDATIAMHWFRKGLRLHDNSGLLHALSLSRGTNDAKKVGKIYPVYIVDPNCYQLLKCSVNRAKFLLECVRDLDKSLRVRGSRLYVISGDPVEILPKLWLEWGVTTMTHDADETGEPYAVERDGSLQNIAVQMGVEMLAFQSETLRPLGNVPGGYVANVGGLASNVPSTMSAFQQLLSRIDRGNIPAPLDSPSETDFPSHPTTTDDCDTYLPLEHPWDIPWPRGYNRDEIGPVWDRKDCLNALVRPIVSGGETMALQQLEQVVTARPDWTASFEKPKTSCTEVSSPSTTVLSPYLSLGCISPRKVWHAVTDATERASSKTNRSKPPVSLHGQLLWRDFNNLMAHSANAQNPGSWGRMEGNPYCRSVPWSSDPKLLAAWKGGRTGYPWIDACMAQLRTEGWIHHLGRHAVACFLTRGDLWQSWEAGADHFEGELIDADYAVNNFNWLWLSCSGFFYQYFRCYSPIAFQKKNDPNGNYIRKWVPELASLPAKYIYEPWKANVSVLNAAGIKLDKNYPRPIVDHSLVSKENMNKLSLAYDIHKDKQAGPKAASSSDLEGAPPQKKVKTQTKLM